MPLVISPIISTEAQAGHDELWGVPSAFLANWSPESPITITSSYTTDLISASNTAQTRTGLRGKPARSISYEILGFDQDDVRLIRSAMMRAASARVIAPLYCDVSTLTVGTTIGTTTIALDTRFRRFYLGQRVMIARWTNDPQLAQWELRTIQAKTDFSLTLTTGVGQDWAKGTLVYPIIEGNPVLDSEIDVLTSQIVRLILTVNETVGKTALPTTIGENLIPDNLNQYAALPILDINPSWQNISTGVTRDAKAQSSGIDEVSVLQGDRPYITGSLGYQFLDRESAWDLLQFFDSRKGRLHPYIQPSPTTDLQFISSTYSTVRVTAHGAELDWTFWPLLYIEDSLGDVYVRRIESFERNDDEDVLTLDDDVPTFSASDVKRCTVAALCTLDRDDFIETWVNNEVMSSGLSFREVPEESDVTDDVPVITTTTGSVPTIPGSGSPDPDPDSTTYITIKKFCDGSITTKCIEQPADELNLYNPDDGQIYTADPEDTIGAGDCSEILDGYHALAEGEEPGGEDQPPWVQDCVSCSATLEEMPDEIVSRRLSDDYEITLGKTADGYIWSSGPFSVYITCSVDELNNLVWTIDSVSPGCTTRAVVVGTLLGAVYEPLIVSGCGGDPDDPTGESHVIEAA